MQTAGPAISGIPKFFHVPCPYLVWETERDSLRYTEKWSELEVNQCAQNREPSRQTDLLTIVTPPPITTTLSDRHTHTHTQACKHARSGLLNASQEQNLQDACYYSPVVAASVRPVSLRLSVCVFPDCVPVCHCIEMGSRRGEAASHVIQMFQSLASQRPTVAELKEALCEGQTDGHRMKTVMIPSTA